MRRWTREAHCGILAAMNDYLAWILAGLGLALFLEGTPYFLFPAKMRSWLELIATQITDKQLRQAGLAGAVIGLALVWLSFFIAN